MVQQYENQTSYQYWDSMWTTNWLAQSFTVGGTAHTLRSVKLRLKRWGTLTGQTFTVSIKNTDVNGRPTGSDLTSGSMDAQSIVADPSNALYEFTMGTEISLSPNTKYAIVCRLSDGNNLNLIAWGYVGNVYANGIRLYSSDSGVTWTDSTGWDEYFEVWGNPLQTLSQNARIKASGQTQTLSQNAAVLAQSRTLDQNARILIAGQTQTVAQDAWIRLFVTTTQTIQQNATIKTTSSQTVTQDARMLAPGQTQIISENAHIKATITQTLSQNARVIVLGQTQTLSENAYLKASGQSQGIIQDAHLKAVEKTQTCSQNAWINIPGQIQSITQNASLWAAGQTALLLQNASIDALTTDAWIDSFALPHVLTFRIVYDATIVDKKIQNGILPRRKMIGKRGRTVEITGWTKQQTDIDTMQAFEDGTTRTFYHPSGGFQVLVRDFHSSQAVDRWNRRIYQLTVVEQSS